MPRDYREVVAALRRKAGDSAVGPDESAILKAKADEIESNHKDAINSTFVDKWPTHDKDVYEWVKNTMSTINVTVVNFRSAGFFPDDFFDESYNQNDDTDEDGIGW